MAESKIVSMDVTRLLIRRGLLVGAILAFLETLAVYTTGWVPAFEFALVWLTDLALVGAVVTLTALALRAGLGARVQPETRARLGQVALLAFPAVLLAVRGNVDPAQVFHTWAGEVRWGLTLAVVAVLLADGLFRRPQAVGVSLRHFFVAAAASQTVLVLAFAARTIDLLAASTRIITKWGILTLGVGAAAAAAFAVALRLAERERESRAGSGRLGVLALFGASAVVAAAFHARPPVIIAPTTAPTTGPGGPDVLLVVLDTVRRDHCSVYGCQRRTTPRLEALARESLVFERAYANATYSLASHASLFTGLMPSRHGAHPVPPASRSETWGNAAQYALDPRRDTIADELRRHGYLTAGISANDVFLARWTGLQRGFQLFVATARRSYGFVPTFAPLVARLGPRAERVVPLHQRWPAGIVTAGALKFVDSAGTRPFFLFLHYFDAHAPYLPAAPFDRMFEGWREPDRSWPRLVSQYDGGVAQADAGFGELLDGLRARGRYESALLVVLADHGEFLGEHGLSGHGDRLFEPVLRVPLLVKLPGQTRPVRVRGRVGLSEVRTLIRRVVTGERDPQRLASDLVLSEPCALAESWTPAPGDRRALPPEMPRSRVAYLGRFKLLEWVGDRDQLFDLAADPSERHDLLAAGGVKARAVEARIRVALPHLDPQKRPAQPPRLSSQMLERLRSLGYLGDGFSRVPDAAR